MGSLNIFLWWGIVLLSITDKIELRKLIDIDEVYYKFPCGSVQCNGIRQYCSDELTCLYCNEDICRATNRPEQCTLQCEKGEIGKEWFLVVFILRFLFFKKYNLNILC